MQYSKLIVVFVLCGAFCTKALAEKGNLDSRDGSSAPAPSLDSYRKRDIAQHLPSVVLLKCKAVKSTGIPEGRDSWFAIRPKQHILTVHHELNGDVNPQPIYKFGRDYGDFTVVLDHKSDRTHKILVFSDRATIPNTFEVHMNGQPITLHWVYIQGGQTEQILFHCIRRH